jgi:hypothetical protein
MSASSSGPVVLNVTRWSAVPKTYPSSEAWTAMPTDRGSRDGYE